MSDHTPSVNYFREFYAVESDGAISLDEARAEFDRMIEAVRAEEREQDTRDPSAETIEHVAYALLQEGLRLRPPGISGQVVPYVTDEHRSLARAALLAAQEVRRG